MADAICDQITQAIHDRLYGNGEMVEIVQPSLMDSYSPRDHQIVLSPGDPEPNEDYSHQGNPPAQAYTMPHSVHCFIIQDETDETNIDSVLAEFSSQVLKTLTEVAEWYQWGGVAIDTLLGTITKYTASNASMAGHSITLNVIYRVSETDPFTAR